jgi:hypothetical protein
MEVEDKREGKVMDGVTITVTVPPDRRLVIDLPDDVPVGATLQVVIRPPQGVSPALESARVLLAAAGKLADLGITDDEVEDVGDDEIEQLGRLAPGARSSDDLLDEERGAG